MQTAAKSVSDSLLRRVLGRIGTDRRFLRGVLTLAGGTAAGQALLVAASPLLTRAYGPDDFGRFGLFFAFINFAAISASLRYETAIVAATTDEEAADLTLLALGLAALSSLLAGAALYGLIAADLLGFGALPTWAALLAVPGCGLIACFLALRYWHLRADGYALVSRASVVQNAARAAVPLLLGLLPLGWAGLALGEVLGRACGLHQLAAAPWRRLREAARRLDLSTAAQMLGARSEFPRYALPSAALNAAALLLPLPLVAHFYSVEAAGHFGLVQRLIAVPLSLVAASVADAFHGQLARYHRQNPAALRGFFLRTAGGLLLLGAGPTLLLATLGPWLFVATFGQPWALAGSLAAAMAPWALAQLVVSPLSRTVFVLGGQRGKLLYDLVALAAVLLSFAIGHALGWTVTATVLLLSWLNALTYVGYFAVLFRVVGANNALLPAGEATHEEPQP